MTDLPFKWNVVCLSHILNQRTQINAAVSLILLHYRALRLITINIAAQKKDWKCMFESQSDTEPKMVECILEQRVSLQTIENLQLKALSSPWELPNWSYKYLQRASLLVCLFTWSTFRTALIYSFSLFINFAEVVQNETVWCCAGLNSTRSPFKFYKCNFHTFLSLHQNSPILLHLGGETDSPLIPKVTQKCETCQNEPVCLFCRVVFTKSVCLKSLIRQKKRENPVRHDKKTMTQGQVP